MSYAMPEYKEDEWKNCNGKPVKEEDVKFRKQEYIAGIGRNGKPIPRWELLKEQDINGFYSKGDIDDEMVANNAINRFRMNTRRQVRVQTRREKLNSRSMNERKDNERKEKRVVSFSVR